MAQKSSIKKLDEDLLELLQELLRNPRVTQLEVTAKINALLTERGEQPVSKSAVNRYKLSMDEVGAKLTESREIAKLWIGKLGAQPAGEVGKLLNEVLRTLAFEITVPMLSGNEKASPKLINQLALAMQRLEKAANDNDKRDAAIRKRAQEDAANEVDAVAKEAGEIQEDLFRDTSSDGDKDILIYTIYFASGFKIQALSSNPSNLRGMQGNVTIDEAAFHERLAEILKAALALTMWGSKVRIISTHNGADSQFAELIEDSRAGKKRYSVHRITLDDACQQGLYKRICLVTGKVWSAEENNNIPGQWSAEAEEQWKANLLSDTATKDDALEEYYCVPKQGGGAYLSRALIESRMVEAPVLRYEASAEFNAWPEHLRQAEIKDWCNGHLMPLLESLKPDEMHGFGEDFGRSGDLTVLAPIAVKQNLARDVPFIVELRNMPFKQQEQILFFIVDRLPRFIGGALDARGNGQYLAEQAKYKYGESMIEEVMLSQGWYLENMPKLKAGFEDAEITIPKDADILNDLRAIQVIKGIPKIPDGKTSSKSGQRHGDAAVAIAMAWFASLMNSSPIEFTPLPDKASRWDGNDDDGDNDMPSFESGGW